MSVLVVKGIFRMSSSVWMARFILAFSFAGLEAGLTKEFFFPQPHGTGGSPPGPAGGRPPHNAPEWYLRYPIHSRFLPPTQHKISHQTIQHTDTAAHLAGGIIQAIHLAMDTVADSLEGLLVAAALHHDVLTAAGQHLAAPLLIPDTGHEPLPQPFPVAVLESLHVCLHTVLFQNGSDLPRADPDPE